MKSEEKEIWLRTINYYVSAMKIKEDENFV